MSESIALQAPAAENRLGEMSADSRAVQQLGRVSVLERFSVDVAELDVQGTETLPAMDATQSPTEYFTGKPESGSWDHDTIRDL